MQKMLQQEFNNLQREDGQMKKMASVFSAAKQAGDALKSGDIQGFHSIVADFVTENKATKMIFVNFLTHSEEVLWRVEGFFSSDKLEQLHEILKANKESEQQWRNHLDVAIQKFQGATGKRAPGFWDSAIPLTPDKHLGLTADLDKARDTIGKIERSMEEIREAINKEIRKLFKEWLQQQLQGNLTDIGSKQPMAPLTQRGISPAPNDTSGLSPRSISREQD